MTDQPTPETDAKLDSGPLGPNDSPDYVRALEIHIHLLRAELADERAKKSAALIAAVDDIERLTAERDDLSEALERNCVQYVQKQQALIAERDTLRAERDDANALARNYAERMKRSDAELAEARALLGLLASIRAAVGDPTGRLMQDELVERCRQLRADRDMWQADAKQRLADNELLRAAKEGS